MQEKFFEKHDKYSRDPALESRFKYDYHTLQTSDTKFTRITKNKFIKDDSDHFKPNFSNINVPDEINSIGSIIVEKDHNLHLPYSFEPEGVLDYNISHMQSSEENNNESTYSMLKFEKAWQVKVNQIETKSEKECPPGKVLENPNREKIRKISDIKDNRAFLNYVDDSSESIPNKLNKMKETHEPKLLSKVIKDNSKVETEKVKFADKLAQINDLLKSGNMTDERRFYQNKMKFKKSENEFYEEFIKRESL